MKHRAFLWLSLPVALLVATLFWMGKIRNRQELNPGQLTLRPGLSALAAQPDWSELEDYQETIPRDIFIAQLKKIYSQGEAWRSVINLHEDYADIRGNGADRIRLHFAKEESLQRPPRYWRAATELPATNRLHKEPLYGLRVAIDPGHIGGEWAKIEERWYKGAPGGHEVKEGELTLATARVLKGKLERLGAKAWLVRDKLAPVTRLRPAEFEPLAIQVLKSRGKDPLGAPLRKQSEILFYRAHEIRRRAQIINHEIQPDIVLCLHFNAEKWGNPDNPIMVSRNHLHLLVNGTYSEGEMRLEDNRFHLLKRLLQRTHDEELALSIAVAGAMAEETGLPPYIYTTSNAKQALPGNPYIYARNLLANRVYHCPVVFLEPYVMNNPAIYERISAGDYEGKREIAGVVRKSLIREYADGVTEGLRIYYSQARGNKK
ncbi:MAG: hypothetical protein GY899_01820 [Verrucomicrobiaceae bacterium]|nr:hypothetical protein [Verrucomicrobiaceae bacterium]